MNFLKNRTVLGIICIALSLIICFAVTPLFNSGLSQKVGIIRVTKDIKAGDQITKDKVQTIEVGSYNLPKDVVKSADTAVGKYATTDLLAGDYILKAKLADVPTEGNAYLYNLNGEKQAISVAIKNFSNGLSGKLISGDIVSVIAPDYRKQGTTVIPAELQYVEVIAVTANTGYDTNGGKQAADTMKNDNQKALPSTVTLLASPEQSKILAELDSDGKLHLSLVYRGTKDNAAKFIGSQDAVIAKLYPKTEVKNEAVTKEDAAVPKQTVPQKETNSHA
ncbi:Flp pilus assembly protein CpaB [Dehalobacter sp.]|uniref:Flp pilus assembly protein CpaB n=1 Tax=Dehalobacter sp. TaxID=1962289 RepID=UPI00258DA013|nr:Flp pilus assembly protein CpaB [Dehalobacter sp.]MDJ0305624.1 Flp pilus assembly protein CpaB [Dehalobacter sp.]